MHHHSLTTPYNALSPASSGRHLTWSLLSSEKIKDIKKSASEKNPIRIDSVLKIASRKTIVLNLMTTATVGVFCRIGKNLQENQSS